MLRASSSPTSSAPSPPSSPCPRTIGSQRTASSLPTTPHTLAPRSSRPSQSRMASLLSSGASLARSARFGTFTTPRVASSTGLWSRLVLSGTLAIAPRESAPPSMLGTKLIIQYRRPLPAQVHGQPQPTFHRPGDHRRSSLCRRCSRLCLPYLQRWQSGGPSLSHPSRYVLSPADPLLFPFIFPSPLLYLPHSTHSTLFIPSAPDPPVYFRTTPPSVAPLQVTDLTTSLYFCLAHHSPRSHRFRMVPHDATQLTS